MGQLFYGVLGHERGTEGQKQRAVASQHRSYSLIAVHYLKPSARYQQAGKAAGYYVQP